MTGLFKNKEKTVGKVVALDVGLIIPNRSQPRVTFDENELAALSASIRENGILQPINVRRCGVNYEIISGERRFRAAKICGLEEVPCIVIDADDERSAVLALIENIQRRDLSYFEEALAIERLIKFYGLTQEEAASRLGKAQSTIANKLRLLKFSDAERGLLIKGNVTERQARALVRIDDQKLRIHAMGEMIINKLNIEQTESMVEGILHGIIPKKREEEPEPAEKKQASRKNFHFPLPRLYINSINKIVKNMKEANIECETVMNHVGDCYEYTIKIHSAAEI
ncbi:MAG TPA: chromosome partitioning protein ParB [Ruminococcaceae bacterium]|jgi:ParB family chromosome partitioning protein|nr:chromosome partitioning protein ParB [Oscillospiraceae bacterium]